MLGDAWSDSGGICCLESLMMTTKLEQERNYPSQPFEGSNSRLLYGAQTRGRGYLYPWPERPQLHRFCL